MSHRNTISQKVFDNRKIVKTHKIQLCYHYPVQNKNPQNSFLYLLKNKENQSYLNSHSMENYNWFQIAVTPNLKIIYTSKDSKKNWHFMMNLNFMPAIEAETSLVCLAAYSYCRIRTWYFLLALNISMIAQICLLWLLFFDYWLLNFAQTLKVENLSLKLSSPPSSEG